MTGPELNAWRKARGWTVREFAARFGCHITTAHGWLYGRCIPAYVPKMMALYDEINSTRDRSSPEPS